MNLNQELVSFVNKQLTYWKSVENLFRDEFSRYEYKVEDSLVKLSKILEDNVLEVVNFLNYEKKFLNKTAIISNLTNQLISKEDLVNALQQKKIEEVSYHKKTWNKVLLIAIIVTSVFALAILAIYAPFLLPFIPTLIASLIPAVAATSIFITLALTIIALVKQNKIERKEVGFFEQMEIKSMKEAITSHIKKLKMYKPKIENSQKKIQIAIQIFNEAIQKIEQDINNQGFKIKQHSIQKNNDEKINSEKELRSLRQQANYLNLKISALKKVLATFYPSSN